MGGGGYTSIYGVSDIPLFYDWVPRYYVFFQVLWSDSNLFLMAGIQPYHQAVSLSLLDTLCLFFGIYENESRIQ